MYIKTKVILILFLLFVIFGFMQFIAQQNFIFPSFVQLEQAEAETNLQRVIEAINLQIKNVDNLNFDWSAWDDTYEFIQDNNKDYLESNLLYETHTASTLNLMYFYNMEQKLVWGKVYDLETEKELQNKPYLNVIEERIQPSSIFAENTKNLDKIQLSGIVLVKDNPVLLAVRPILTSENLGPVRGYVIFGRFLTEAIIDDIRNQTRIDFKLTEAGVTRLADYQTTGYDINRIDSQKLAVSTLVKGIDKQPLLQLNTISPRKITQNGLTSIRYSMMSVGLLSILIMLIVLLLMQRIVLNPISQLASHMAVLTSSGDYSNELDVSRNDEIGILANSYNTLLQQINASNEQLIQLADHDQLTELPNRRRFWQYFEVEWRRGQREKTPVSVLMIDIDYFKAYNDNYGHVDGDRCLHTVAQVLQNCLNRPADLVARYGGEEFVFVLPNTPHEGANIIGNRVIEKLADAKLEHSFSSVSNVVTVSIGLSSSIPTAGINMNELLKRADQALYQAKENGRNQVYCAHDDYHLDNQPAAIG